MEDSAQLEARKAGARRTLTALLIIVAALFLGSLAFMVVRGDQNAPEERRVIAVLPVQGSTPEAGAGRYDGFGQYLAAYFGRADPMDLGVFGPASTARLVEAGEEPLALGRTLGADMVLVAREVARDLDVVLVVELFHVDDGATIWRGEYDVGPDMDRSALLLEVAMEVTDVLHAPR